MIPVAIVHLVALIVGAELGVEWVSPRLLFISPIGVHPILHLSGRRPLRPLVTGLLTAMLALSPTTPHLLVRGPDLLQKAIDGLAIGVCKGFT